MNGAIILDKPPGISSHSAVSRVRRLLSEPGIGHLGTLDPFATGVLVLLVGKATRLARFYMNRKKSYQGTIRFGFSTDSYDYTGNPTSSEQSTVLDSDQMRGIFREFTGTFLQQPPSISAKKIGGVPAYRLARKGQEPKLAAVQVTVHELDLLAVDGPLVRFQCRVSSGTYIRTMAHEMGKRTGVGAHLQQLRRTAVGEFVETSSVTLEQLEERLRQGALPLIPMEELLPEFASVVLPESLAQSVSNGNMIALQGATEWVKLLDQSGKLKAVAQHTGEGDYHPVVVFKDENSNEAKADPSHAQDDNYIWSG